MWITNRALDWFKISQDSMASLREELAAAKAERDRLQKENLSLQVNFDWLRMQVNTLQLERGALLEKAYNIKLPVPEIVRSPTMGEQGKLDEFSFEDIGDEVARKLGLPLYDVFNQKTK